MRTFADQIKAIEESRVDFQHEIARIKDPNTKHDLDERIEALSDAAESLRRLEKLAELVRETK